MVEKQFFSGRIPQHLYDAAEKFCDSEEISKTELLVKSLSAYIGTPAEMPSVDEAVIKNIANLQQRMSDVEKQIEALKEKAINTDSKQLTFDNVNNNEINNVITKPEALDTEPVILTTNEVCEKTGIKKRALEYIKGKNKFPKTHGDWTILRFAGQRNSPKKTNLWEITKSQET